jgi:hypothetical protein
LTVGANVQIAATAGSVNCTPLATTVQVAGIQRPVEHASQWWQGTVAAVATNGSSLSVSVSDGSDGALRWLSAQSPSCASGPLTFDLSSGPAVVSQNNGAPIAVGDSVAIASMAGTVNCVPIASFVRDFGSGSGQSGDGGGRGGDQ